MYNRAKKLGERSGPLSMLTVMSLVRRYIKTKDKALLKQSISIIDSQLKNSMDYRQEFLLARAYISGVLLGDLKHVNIKNILDRDPYLTDNHWHDPMIYHEHMTWDVFSRWCEEIYNKSDKKAIFQGLYAYCLLKSDHELEAGQAIDSAIEKDPKSQLIATLKGLQYLENKNESKGLALLNSIVAKNPSKLALILMGIHCKTPTHAECAKVQWQDLLRRDPGSLVGLSGMAESMINDGKIEDAREIVDRGIRLSPTYEPLIRSKMIINRLKGDGQ